MPETAPGAALAQTPKVQPSAEPFSQIPQDSPLLGRLAVVSTPETRGGPFGRVECGKCSLEFLASRPNLKCPRCGGTPTGASLERAFGTGLEEEQK